MTVMVPTEFHIDGQTYYAVAAVPMMDQVPGIMTKREHKIVDRGVEQVVNHAHAHMGGYSWKTPQASRRLSNYYAYCIFKRGVYESGCE